MNKKALSPLVATFLLIAFAVALGFIVMNWGKSYVEEKAEFTAEGAGEAVDCNLVELGFIKVGGRDRACYNSAEGTVDVFIENGPAVEAANLQVTIVGTKGVETLDNVLDAPLRKAASAQIKFNYPAGIGTMLQLKFTAVVDSAEGTSYCTKEALVTEELQEC